MAASPRVDDPGVAVGIVAYIPLRWCGARLYLFANGFIISCLLLPGPHFDTFSRHSKHHHLDPSRALGVPDSAPGRWQLILVPAP